MTPAERARLNRAAAELAGWRFSPTATAHGAGLTITRPTGEQVTVCDREGKGLACVPDFLTDPALWWPLVERMARELVAREGTWEGPSLLPPTQPGWVVSWLIPGGDGGMVYEKDPGAAAVKAALTVAAALGLGGGERGEENQ